MRSPTAALVWEIWRRHRSVFAAVLALTAIGRVIAWQDPSAGSSPLVELLQMVSFLLLFGIFSYTEAGASGIGRFPRRLFILPVSSRRLVAVIAAGVVSVELLYLLWLDPAAGAAASVLNAALLGALMLCSQAVIWSFEGLGPFRLVLVGLLAVAAFWVGLLPSFAPSPPPVWRSGAVLAPLTAVAAAAAFAGVWRHISRARSGAGQRPFNVQAVMPALAALPALAAAAPRRRRAFRSAAAAHFWYEWH